MKTKTIRSTITALMTVPMLALGICAVSLAPQPVSAADGLQEGADDAKGDSVAPCLFTNTDVDKEVGGKPNPDYCASGVFTNIANAFLFVLGAVSVLMLIYGGIRYTISGGDTASITAAKNTIIYAVVGIVVAIMAYAIVNFVIGELT